MPNPLPRELGEKLGGVNIADILERAADLIEPEGAWIKGCSARTSPDGFRRLPSDPDATCWCLTGAVSRISPDWEAEEQAILAVRRVVYEWPSVWNDRPRRIQSQAVAKLREAAAKAREMEGEGEL